MSKEANTSIKDLDIVSYAAGPGLVPCLRVGAVVARSLSSFYKIPIYPVNHAIGHIELGKLLTGATNPLVLLVSGGHTMILAFLNKQWSVFGETLDITLGQLLRSIQEDLLDLLHHVEKILKNWHHHLLIMYHYHILLKEMMFLFLVYLSATKSVAKENKSDACYSLQETAFAMISEAVERALSFTKKKGIDDCWWSSCKQKLI